MDMAESDQNVEQWLAAMLRSLGKAAVRFVMEAMREHVALPGVPTSFPVQPSNTQTQIPRRSQGPI